MALIEFSSRHFLQRERMDAARDTYAAMASVVPHVERGAQFDIDLRIRLLPGVSLAYAECAPMTVIRGPGQLADGNDDISLFFNPGGPGAWGIQQRGPGDLQCAAGTGCVSMNEWSGRTDFHGPRARFLSIGFSRERLLPLLADLDTSLRRPLLPSLALQLLTQQAMELTQGLPATQDSAETGSDAARLQLSDKLLDLSALVLGATRQAQEHAQAHGLRHARLKAIQADLRVHAGRGDLSLEWVAGRHGITPRYVRALFEQAETSFSDYVLELRLQRAMALLQSPAQAQTAVNALAFDAGFNNVSWFYRAFKQRFGTTPRDARQQGLEPNC